MQIIIWNNAKCKAKDAQFDNTINATHSTNTHSVDGLTCS